MTLSPDAQKLLDAAREDLSPSSASRAAILKRIEAQGASAPGSGGTMGAGTKLLIGAVVVGTIAGAAWRLWPREEIVPHESEVMLDSAPEQLVEAKASRPNILESVQEAIHPDQESASEEVPVAKLTPEPAGGKRKIGRRNANESPPRIDNSAPSVDSERVLLLRAQRNLRDGDADAALRVLRSHQEHYPDGLLAPERDAAIAVALCTSGDTKGVAAAREFLQAHPTSPLGARVKAVCKP